MKKTAIWRTAILMIGILLCNAATPASAGWWGDFWDKNGEAIIAAGVAVVGVAIAILCSDPNIPPTPVPQSGQGTVYRQGFEASGMGGNKTEYQDWLRNSDQQNTPAAREWWNTPDNQRPQWLEGHPQF